MKRTSLKLSAYHAGTFVTNSGLERAENVVYGTIYPGGLFADCTFFLPREDVAQIWSVVLNDKIIIRNGILTVYEGYLTIITPTVEENRAGFACTCLGAWGNILMQRKTNKPWALTSLGEDVWRVPAAAYNASDRSLEDMFQDDSSQVGFQRWIPNPIAFANADYIRKVYTCPTGQTIKHATGKVNLQEAAQAWLVGFYNQTSTTAEYSRTASGPETFDVTPATPASVVWLYYQSAAGQTATNFNTLHGDFEYVTIYTETGDINLTEITKDVAAMASELSTDYSLVAANALSLVPFYAAAEGEAYADVLTRAASYGDTNNNPWAVGVRESDLSSDGKPVIFAEQQPVLTSTDYLVRLNELSLVAPFSAEQNLPDAVRNWIAVTYQDQNSNSHLITPDDDATLKDQTSIDLYGRRDEWLTTSSTDSAAATAYAKRFLAQAKFPRWICSNGITITGEIRSSDGSHIPASEIRAGKRIRVESWLNDVSGTGLTFLITATSYTDSNQTCRISVGQPNSLDFWLANLQRTIENSGGNL